MNNAYEVLIKLAADLKGGKDATEVVKELTAQSEKLQVETAEATKAAQQQAEAQKTQAKTAKEAADAEAKLADEAKRVRESVDLSTNRTLAYEQAAIKTTKAKDAWAASSGRLREGLKGLAFQIPVVGALAERLVNPVTAVATAAVAVFALVKKEIAEFEAAIEDTSAGQRFNTWLTTQKESVAALRREMRDFRAELDEFNGDPNDPQRIARQQSEALRNNARREEELDAARVKAGKLTAEDAAQRALIRESKLANDINSVRENEVTNTSIRRNMAANAAEAQARVVAGLRDPEATKQRLADLKSELEAAKADREKAVAYMEANKPGTGPWNDNPRYDAAKAKRDGLSRTIEGLNQQIAGIGAIEPGETDRYNAELRKLQRLQRRAQALDQIGEEQVVERPFERQQFQRDQHNRNVATVIAGSPQDAAVKQAIKELTAEFVRHILEARAEARNLIKLQRNP